MTKRTIFEQVGVEGFERILERFYAGVADDPLLRPMYPEDLGESRAASAPLFDSVLRRPVVVLGGTRPSALADATPSLPDRRSRARRLMGHMTRALAALDLAPSTRDEMQHYFEDAATFLINRRCP